MSRVFKIPKCPYDSSTKIFSKSEIEFTPGVTVLVGSNGSGKSTLLHHIKSELLASGTPYTWYDNLAEGGSTSIAKYLATDELGLVAGLVTSSEGEQIMLNIGQFAKELGRFMKVHQNDKEVWILIDGVDSGLSIDYICDIKEQLFEYILEHSPDIDVYIIIAGNTYEICAGENCFDVYKGQYKQFKTYAQYKKFILASRKRKDKHSN